ncbi:endonuclease domain-containing 1 protein-like [Salvelinus sp. IW2-2015]|uniref:endonuclease domain-containing 1 protein-like n=1 Tax=Salvelinus sp. IW2-2015 TaxID=2691554 RepID=UPI000CEB151B|nr:endonuclease domain-containing 1 protein-like [Salvelinus alpinus]
MMGVLNHLSTLLLLSLLPPALSHVVKNFSVTDCEKFFLEGTTPNLPGILVDGIVKNEGQNQNRYKPICQNYNNIYRFATLYDTTNRIPVFSAYTFTGPGGKRPKNIPWKIEPQLEDIDIKEMKTQHEVKVLNNNKDIVNQAVNTDYDANGRGLDRGHLFPCSHAPDDETKNSTFTLTNAVPQVGSFNRGRWRVMECNVRKYLELNCKNNNNKIEAYVVTGALPNITNKLNNQVNIPDLLWTAYCCYNDKDKKWMAGAYWGENKKDNGKILTLETLGALEVKLKESYKVDGNVKVFHDKCPRNVNVQQVKRGREESGDGNGERNIKMARTSRGLKECDEEDGCDCDCDEKS